MDRSSGRLAQLRAAIAVDPHPNHRVAHTATTRLIARAETAAAGRPLLGWGAFSESTATPRIGAEDWQATLGVTANMIAVAGLAEAEDFATLNRLVRQYGPEAVASIQAAADERLGLGRSMPLATRFARTVTRTQRIVDSLVAGGTEHQAARAIARRCARTAYSLVMTDVDRSPPGPRITTVEDAITCVDTGGIPAWRGQVAIVAADPWSPYPTELLRLLREGDRDAAADTLESAVKYYRDLAERHDRQLVAREIRRLVAMSGLSQRQFAAMSGTSAPRLSTYVNGLVTPSASMMVRFTRVSELAERQGRDARGSSA